MALTSSCTYQFQLYQQIVTAAIPCQTSTYSRARSKHTIVRAIGQRWPARLRTSPSLGSSHIACAFWSRKRKGHTESPLEEDTEAVFETDLAPGDPTPVIIEIETKEGDTMHSLAQNTGLDFGTLLQANGGNPVLEPGAKLRFQMPLPENMEELVEVIQGAEAAKAAAKLAEAEGADTYASDGPADNPVGAERLLEGSENSGRAAEGGTKEVASGTAREVGGQAGWVNAERLGFRVVQHDAPGRTFVTTFSYLSPFIAAGLLAGFIWLAIKHPVFSQSEKNGLAERARRRREAMLGGRPFDRKASERTVVSSDFDRLSPGRILAERADDEPLTSGEEDVPRSSEQSGGAESEASPSGNGLVVGEPAWLRLSKVYYLLLPGNQSASFRLQPQLPDEFSWIAWEVREDALQLMAWLLERGQVSAGDRVVGAKPYDFMRLAQLNERGVSFIAKGALQMSLDFTDDELWVAMISAATSVPLRPLQEGITSVDELLLRHEGQRLDTSQVAHVHVPQTVPQTSSQSPIDVDSSTSDPETAKSPASSSGADTHLDAAGLAQDPHKHAIESLSDAAGTAASGSGVSSSSASNPEDGAISSEDHVSAQRAGLEDSSVMGNSHDDATEEQTEPEDFATVGTPLNSFTMGRGRPEDGTPVGTSQSDATGQQSRPDGGDSAGTSENGADASQSTVEGSENDGRASGDPQSRERNAEYAEMLQDMRRIRKSAETMGYVPKFAREFSKDFAAREQAFIQTAASDPSFDPFKAADEAHEAEFRGSVRPSEPERRAPSQPVEDQEKAAHSGNETSPALGASVDKDWDVPARSTREADAQARLLADFEASEQETSSAGEPAYIADSARVVDFTGEPGELQQLAEFTDSKGTEAPEQVADIHSRRKRGSESSPYVINPRGEVPKKLRTDWWRHLPVLYLPMVGDEDGGDAFIMVDVSRDSKRLVDVHIVGFASRADAQKFAWLYNSYKVGPCRLEAISPEDVERHVEGQDIGVTVFRDGMLPLPPRLPYDQLPNTLAAYAHEME